MHRAQFKAATYSMCTSLRVEKNQNDQETMTEGEEETVLILWQKWLWQKCYTSDFALSRYKLKLACKSASVFLALLHHVLACAVAVLNVLPENAKLR